MDENKNDYIDYQSEYESFDKNLNKDSIKKSNAIIITHTILITIVLVFFFIFSVLNLDVFKPLGLFGLILRYIVGVLTILYLVLFFKIMK